MCKAFENHIRFRPQIRDSSFGFKLKDLSVNDNADNSSPFSNITHDQEFLSRYH